MQCRVAAERAVEIAEQASADFERVWALAHVALGHYGTLREFALLDRAYEEALAKGYTFIAGNVLFNEIWDRVHTLTGGLDGPLAKVERIPAELVELGRRIDRDEPGDARARSAPRRAATCARRRPSDTRVLERASSRGGRISRPPRRCSSSGASRRPPRSFRRCHPGTSSRTSSTTRATRVGIARALGHTEEAVELARRASADDARPGLR